MADYIDESFDPIDVLNYAIEELGHTQAELAELLDSRSRASEILSRRRALTVDMIHKISETWKIPADLLVRPYKIERAAWEGYSIRINDQCRIVFRWTSVGPEEVETRSASASTLISGQPC